MGEVAEGILARLMRAYDVHDENALAIQMGRDMSTIRVWKSRDSVPLLVLTDAAKATGYSLSWLRGEGEAAEREPQRTPDDDASRVALSPREQQLIERYRATDEDGRTAVEMVTSSLAVGGKPARSAAPRVSRKVKYDASPSDRGVTMQLAVREGDAPWKVEGPVRSDTHNSGAGINLGGAALLPISSAGESRPLVLTIKGNAGQAKGYEVIPMYRGSVNAGRAVRRADGDDGLLDQAGDMAFSLDWLRENFGHTSGQLASVQVHGDSMAPTLISGESIVIDTAVKRVDVSGIYVIEAHGDRLVKRIDRRLDASLVIISDNKAYAPETVRADEIKVLGRMVGRWQR